MAITVILALVSAMILSVTFVPAGVAFLFRRPRPEKRNVVMEGAARAYRPVLQAALRLRWAMVAGGEMAGQFCEGDRRADIVMRLQSLCRLR